MLNLNYRRYGAGPPLIILHGLFGSSDNWHSLAKRWGGSYEVFAIDLRNHGASPHDSLMSYSEMVRDLKNLLYDLRLKSINLLGHSLGGKVAMLFASRYPERVDGLAVLDIGISKTEGKHLPIIQALNEINPEEFSERADVQTQLEKIVESPEIQQFLLKNVLRRIDSSLTWRFNRDALLENYHEMVGALDLKDIFMGPTLFLRGSRSDYLGSEIDPNILRFFPMAQLSTIEDAGHWLHAEQPEQVYRILQEFFLPA